MFASRPSDLSVQQQQVVDLRKQLISSAQAEIKVFEQMVATISQQDQLSKQECLFAIDRALAALERVCKAGDWESSLFLRNTLKPVKILRDKMLQLQQTLAGTDQVHRITAPALPQGKVPVYISLFQAEGLNLAKWTMQVRSLARYVQGRPIYHCEEDVQRMIRSKVEDSNEGYVVVAVLPSDIVNTSSARVDRNGCKLVTLADQAIYDQYIIEFVHQDKRYCWVENNLVMQG